MKTLDQHINILQVQWEPLKFPKLYKPIIVMHILEGGISTTIILVLALVPLQKVVVGIMALIVTAAIIVVGVIAAALWKLRHHHHHHHHHHHLSYSYFHLVLTMCHSKYS